jgi:hypothetical protein
LSSTTVRIVRETLERAEQAIANGEPAGAEFLAWAERLAGLNSGTPTPQTWRKLKEIAEKMLYGEKEAEVNDMPEDYAQ